MTELWQKYSNVIVSVSSLSDDKIPSVQCKVKHSSGCADLLIEGPMCVKTGENSVNQIAGQISGGWNRLEIHKNSNGTMTSYGMYFEAFESEMPEQEKMFTLRAQKCTVNEHCE